MNPLDTCFVRREGDTLTLGNNRIERTFLWNGGHLISRRIADPKTGRGWDLANDGPDWRLPEPGKPATDAGLLTETRVAQSPFAFAHLRVDITARHGAVEMKRVFRIYPDVPAIACDLWLRGTPAGSWRHGAADASARGNIEDGRLGGAPQAIPTECLCPGGSHWDLTPVRFYDISDHRNTFTTSTPHPAYRNWSDPALMAGNLLFAEESGRGNGFFFLKEAPCSDVQLAWPGQDFTCCAGHFCVVGLGLEPADLAGGDWVPGYGVVTGLYGGGEEGRLRALRSYQRRGRLPAPGRDHMILMNTWGDRGQDARICEAFTLRELEAGARLGITHFQLDDGWQNGRSSNSAFAGGRLTEIWNAPDYWQPNPERFPDGLGPVVARGRELGIEVCVWFNPSADHDYAHWRDDADVLIGLHRQHGIRTFKIDGVAVPTKTAEQNLRAMFDTVMEACGGETVFNLDVTAGRRYGYHYFHEYGNIFVENRYTDWGNYFPHWTLRNLWMLSRHVPAQRLQMEFLNLWRNREGYGDDPLAPANVPFDYAFAITMMAQPLAWFEGSGLPDEAFTIAPLVRTYRRHMEAIHAGDIFPIGEEPSGHGWTGFQSLGDGDGYLLVFRERNADASRRLRLWGLRHTRVKCTCLGGQGEDFSTDVGPDGEVLFTLPEQLSFALYRYEG